MEVLNGLIEQAPGVVRRPRPKTSSAAGARFKCVKCRTAQAHIIVGNEKWCSACMKSVVLGKMVNVAKVQKALVHGDQVSVAVSGGPCSMALVDILNHIRTRNWSRQVRGEVMFKMHVVHVNESAAFSHAISNQIQEHANCIASFIESRYSPESVTCVNLEDVFGPGYTTTEKRGKLQMLLSSILDGTGRQDFLAILRMELLRLVAERLGCNKLLLGDSASRLAANFIAAAAKGEGFQAPASLQLADAREGISRCCVMRPMRDFCQKELVMHAHFEQLPFMAMPVVSGVNHKTSVNELSDTFVSALQVANPGALSTVMKTACKLEPFDFNTVALAPPPPCEAEVPRSSTWKQSITDARNAEQRSRAEAIAHLPLCLICRSPQNPCTASVLESMLMAESVTEVQGPCEDVQLLGGHQSQSLSLCRSCRSLLCEQGERSCSPDVAGVALDVLPSSMQARLKPAGRARVRGASEYADEGAGGLEVVSTGMLRKQIQEWLLEAHDE